MGKRIERSIDWMDNVARVICINARKGSEHTVEYEDFDGNYCVVRVPASFTAFLSMLTKPSKAKLSKAA